MSDFSVHDDVMLAALDFIDSFDSDSDPPTTPTTSAARGSIKRQNTTSGQRVRAEIERLRFVVAQLEERVEELRHGPSHHRPIGDHQQEGNTSDIYEWNEVVAWEKIQRELAQTRNVQLRELLLKQTRVVAKLKKLVARGQRFQTTSRIARQLVAEEAEVARRLARGHHQSHHDGAAASVDSMTSANGLRGPNQNEESHRDKASDSSAP